MTKTFWKLDGIKLPLEMIFEMNGTGYRTDIETLKVLQSVVASSKEIGNYTMVACVMDLGLTTGRIQEI